MSRQPVQVWTPFTADQHIARGGPALGAGIGSGLQSLGEMLEAMKKKASMAQVLRKKLSLMDPDNKDSYQSMGLEDLIGTEKAQMEQVITADREHSRRMDEALMEERALRAMSIREALANQERLPAFLGRMNELRQPQLEGPEAGAEGPANLVPGMGSLGALLQSSQETGYRPDLRDVLDDMLRSGAAGGNEPLQFDEDPVSGNRFARAGKSVLPSGVNPARQSSEAEELFDPDGQVIGHRVPIGGGKFTFKPAKAAASGALLPVIDPTTKQPIPGMGMDASGKVHDYRDQMQKTMGSRIDTTPGKGKTRKYNPATGRLE